MKTLMEKMRANRQQLDRVRIHKAWLQHKVEQEAREAKERDDYLAEMKQLRDARYAEDEAKERERERKRVIEGWLVLALVFAAMIVTLAFTGSKP